MEWRSNGVVECWSSGILSAGGARIWIRGEIVNWSTTFCKQLTTITSLHHSLRRSIGRPFLSKTGSSMVENGFTMPETRGSEFQVRQAF